MKANALPVKECDVCAKAFIQMRMGQRVCGPRCAVKEQKVNREAEKKERKTRLAFLDPKRKSKARAIAKTAMHAYIRAKYEGEQCISCETILRSTGKPGGDFDAGHFRSVGSAKHMEFVENNIHGQCKRCNRDLGGNALEYQKGLIARYGQTYVDQLLADNEVRKLTIDDYQTIAKVYRLKLKDLLAARAEGQAV